MPEEEKKIIVWVNEEGEIIGFENVPEGFKVVVEVDVETLHLTGPGPTFVEYSRW